MFTVGALVLATAIAWLANRYNEQDRSTYDRSLPDDRIWILVLHARQDLKLIAFLLFGVIVMLGIVADRIR